MNERIYWYCRWCVRVMPIVCACAHCLLVLAGGAAVADAGDDALRDMACVTAVMLLTGALLPLSLLFALGAVWRVPFVYVAGVCMGRLVCGTWEPTAAMCSVCKTLALVCAVLYMWCAVKRAWLGSEAQRHDVS